ncbi:hypothetical protein FRB95_008018 [Tulasnella sp. JGI-2019a]|nr:hypothetical protein FRB95_008018 [Tulasnella sp. JGI-2019a]
MKLNTKLLASFVLWGVSVNAWGPLGHSTVAAVALQYLKPETLERTRTILCHEGLAEETLVTVANWADSYKRTREGSYSYDHHFIDAEDEPLAGNCHVDMERDCSPKGCIVTAIANYTRRASDETLNIAQNAEALRFLTHFFGDLHQPLHAEGIKKAGNHIPVLFNGKQSNLHRGEWGLFHQCNVVSSDHFVQLGTSTRYKPSLETTPLKRRTLGPRSSLARSIEREGSTMRRRSGGWIAKTSPIPRRVPSNGQRNLTG